MIPNPKLRSIALALLASVILLASCSPDDNPEPETNTTKISEETKVESELENDTQIPLVLEEDATSHTVIRDIRIEGDTLYFTLENIEGRPISFSEPVMIEHLVGEEWKLLHFEGMAFDLPLYSLMQGRSREMHVRIDFLEDHAESGRYRLLKEITKPEIGDFVLATEFDWEDAVAVSSVEEGGAAEQFQAFMTSLGLSDMSATDDYPAFFGGSYLDAEGQLVILVIEDSEGIPEAQKDAIELASSAPYRIMEVRYAYRELLAGMDAINAVLSPDDRPEIASEIAGIRLLDDDNHILIQLLSYDEATIEAFREQVFDAPYLHFEAIED